jgi:hypothetical protein
MLALWLVNTKNYTLRIKTELSKRNLPVHTWTLRFIFLELLHRTQYRVHIEELVLPGYRLPGR